MSADSPRHESAATWQNQILKAAQVWAQATNLNFSLVSDSGANTGSGNYQQGNPSFGDIRIAGFNFGSSALGMAYMPPKDNNYSVAGDMAFNTGQPFNIGTTYDLFTAAAHEIGHARLIPGGADDGLPHLGEGVRAEMVAAFDPLDVQRRQIPKAQNARQK